MALRALIVRARSRPSCNRPHSPYPTCFAAATRYGGSPLLPAPFRCHIPHCILYVLTFSRVFAHLDVDRLVFRMLHQCAAYVEVVSELCWVLSFMTANNNDFIARCVALGIVPILLEVLDCGCRNLEDLTVNDVSYFICAVTYKPVRSSGAANPGERVRRPGGVS